MELLGIIFNTAKINRGKNIYVYIIRVHIKYFLIKFKNIFFFIYIKTIWNVFISDFKLCKKSY